MSDTTYRGSFLVKTGDLAYWDTIGAGLVPCKVSAISADANRATLTVTADRGPYRRNESVDTLSMHVVPRTAVYVKSGQYRIAGAPVRYLPTGQQVLS